MGNNNQRKHLLETENWFDKLLKSICHGSKPKIFKEECVVGKITPQIKSKITKLINSKIKDDKKFKIGKTGDTYIRSDQKDYRRSYNNMYLLYSSKTKKVIDEIEINYIEKYILFENNDNKRINAPGKEMVTYNGIHYLYLVTE